MSLGRPYSPLTEMQPLSKEREVAHHPTRVGDNETLYEALDRMGLLRQANSSAFGHLVRKGELGMCSDNGVPLFLAPGRHVLWSAYNSYKGNVPISRNMIQLGQNLQIVTIDNSEIGLSTSKGANILLVPGQHILQAPQRYVKSERVDKNYVHLGTHHRISVPVGNVAVAYNEGRKVIITPEDLNVDDAHRDYIVFTKGKMFMVDSPTFVFDPQAGFKSIQMEDIQLEKLTVNTSEMFALDVVGSVRYQISDPVRAFLLTEDVEGDIKKQAYATLTAAFSQLSINEIASSLASTHVSKGKEERNDIPHDMLHHATALFMEEFQSVVKGWGVEAKLVNITSMQLQNKTFTDSIQSRAQQSMQANTRLEVVAAESDAILQEAERNRKKQVIEAEGKSEAIRKLADANVYADEKRAEGARLLSTEPLARELALMDGHAKIMHELGDKTTIIASDYNLGNYSASSASGQTMWLSRNNSERLSPLNSINVVDAEAQKVPMKK
tara:strand:- start:89 stop:1579 length:1491 start_codon:yes stop_codon:yes gene_type:complete